MPDDIVQDLLRALKDIESKTGSFIAGPLPPALGELLNRAIEEITKLREPPTYMKGNDILSIQGLQESLERSMGREKELKEKVINLTKSAQDYKRRLERLFQERPAKLKEGWKKPELSCSHCLAKIVPVAYLDVNEWHLLWPEECEECHTSIPEEANRVWDDNWPFVDEAVYSMDFGGLGFDIE